MCVFLVVLVHVILLKCTLVLYLLSTIAPRGVRQPSPSCTLSHSDPEIRWRFALAQTWPSGLGLGLVAQIMFESGPSSDLVQMLAIKPHRRHFDLSWPIVPPPPPQRTLIRSCSHLKLVTQSDSGKKSYWLDFIRDFRSCPLPGIVPHSTLQTGHLIFLWRSSEAKINLKVVRASLKDYPRITSIYELK
jgi:hypothetical protein